MHGGLEKIRDSTQHVKHIAGAPWIIVTDTVIISKISDLYRGY